VLECVAAWLGERGPACHRLAGAWCQGGADL